MLVDQMPKAESLTIKIQKFWELSGEKIRSIQKEYDNSKGSPVFTVKGKYTTRGWTEWTQGFQFGSALLQFDATGEQYFLDYGRENTLRFMDPHVSHTGVHDHGFNNVSTYGNLLRLMKERKTPHNEWQQHFYELALKISGAVQAGRWTVINGGGFIHSFNGAHSLFVDTIRSCRALVLSYVLGHTMQGEGDVKIDLLQRVIEHMAATAKYSIYYNEGRDHYDEWGRTAHESVFNVRDGNYRCPNAQQGFSGFTTWTRGLAWAMCGFAEELEWLETVNDAALAGLGGKPAIRAFMQKAAQATCDFYLANSCSDGIPYWDTGAPQLHKMGDYLNQAADPFNEFEPVDSSAAAIAAQGLLRFGNYLSQRGENEKGEKYYRGGLTIVNRLLEEPYLSSDPAHQGLLLHSIYHRPNGWDYIPAGSKIPYGESSMWGDYHIREVVLYLQKLINKEPYYCFYNAVQ